MKKLFTVLAIVLFTVSISAQETKPVAKTTPTKEACCAKKDSKKCTAEEKAKCTDAEKAKCEKTKKACCAKK